MKKTLFTLLTVFVTFAFAQERGLSSLRRTGALRGGAARSAAQEAPTAASSASASGGEASDLNFNAAPVDMVFEVYSKLVGKTVLKDPGAPNPTITLQSRPGQKLTTEEQIEAIEVVLEMNGIHFEPYKEKFVRALPRGKVRKEGIPLIMDPDFELTESGRVISMMIPFKNISAQDEAQKALEGFKSDSGILLVFERTNSILATDTEQNIKRMLEIAKSIDVATPVLENVFVRQIKNAGADEIKTALEAIVQESQKELEKAGKGVQNVAANNNAAGSPFARPGTGVGLLGRRPGQPAQPQQVNNASLVMSVSDADRGMIRGKVLILADERSNKLIIVTQKANMDFFDRVIEQLDVETTPDTVVKVYRLKYAEAEEVSDMINDLIGNSSKSTSSKGGNQNPSAKSGTGGSLTRPGVATPAAKKPANQRSGDAKAGELTKDNTTVLADKRINGLVVMTEKDLVPTIEQIIESMDVKLSQVLIETVIIEVTLGDDLNTGIDWVRLGDKRAQETRVPQMGPNGLQMYNYTDGKGSVIAYEDVGSSFTRDNDDGSTTTWTRQGDGLFSTVTSWVRDGLWNDKGGKLTSMLGGGGGSGADLLKTIVGVASNATEAANLLSPAGTGINWFFKSDALNLGAIIQASKSDSRAKYIASPIIMTVDNKEATIDATESRKFFSGYETSSSYSTYMRTPKYDSKDIGIQIKVTPKINPNGTVMLKIEEEYSQLGAGQTILVGEGSQKETIDTALTRKVTADALLENMQTVILTGLTETFKQESEKGIPILKDIPWIGKWLFGSVTQTETRKELLVFMTPYVLDDGAAAQAEAIRRKKTLSDPNPWEDHGWSLSELADPVSKKELLRRLKDEWRKQDEERRTKLAIEQEKVKRVKSLRNMSKEEREFWLEMHKEELEEDEQQEAFEKKLEEMKQNELSDLAADIRRRKMQEANQTIRDADRAARLENERGRLEAEKRGETPAGDEPELEHPPEPAKTEQPVAAATAPAGAVGLDQLAEKKPGEGAR